MRLYVDFDDVLCQTARGLMDRVNAQFGKALCFEQIVSFNLEDSFELSGTEWQWLVGCFHDPDVLMGFEPIDGAGAVLQGWRERGGEIDIVTGRPPATLHHSRSWLELHGVPCDRILFVDKYGRGFEDAPGAQTLSMDAVASMAYSAAIDDSAEMMTFLNGRAAYPLMLLDRPWNRQLPKDVAKGVTRLPDWDAVAHVLGVEVD
jgi:uncharacterized HAD superfamily protein